MKIQGIKSADNKSDILELNGNVLKINGKDYDLDNLESPSILEDADNTQFFIDNQCYIDLNGIEQIKIYVDNNHYFLFVNNNAMLFYDRDLNSDIDKSELSLLLDVYNMKEEDRIEAHKKFKASFTDKEWQTRMEACNPKR